MAFPRNRNPPGLAPPRPFFLADANAHSASGSSVDVSSLDPASDSDSPASQPRAHRRRYSNSYIVDQSPDSGSWSPSTLYADPSTPAPTSSPQSPTQLPTRPPPSSYTFPFQAYPGNPDPIPTRRRISVDSANSRSGGEELEYISLENTPDLRRPIAPFMTGGSSASLPRSPSTSSIYKQSAAAAAAEGPMHNLHHNMSTHSFRAPFLSPASRPSSSLWAPPSYNNNLMGLASPAASTTALPLAPLKDRAPLPSTRLADPLTAADKPWMAERIPRVTVSYFITLLCMVLGLAGAAFLCWTGVRDVQFLDPNTLCLVLDENFDSGTLDTGTWSRDVELGGFGNGEFQMTTDSDDNLFIQNSELYIMPTLTPDNIINGGNFTLSGCTATLADGKTQNATACNIRGGNIINPIQSARINTKGKKTIRYGKVEVRAKMPTGDWLWPAIWMLPQNNTYGAWPLSGEIDLIESRGNGPEYPAQGRNFVRASLNYGPLPNLVKQLYGWFSLKRTSFADSFHVYTLEWTDKFIRASVDKRTHAMLFESTKSEKESYFRKGGFPATARNTSGLEVAVQDIWGSTTAPFDQEFYLIIDVAAGGTSGWFPDSVGDKPWFDGSLTALRDFVAAKDVWSATWPESSADRALRVDYVKMWEICK